MQSALLHAPAAFASGRPQQPLRRACCVRRACFNTCSTQRGASADKGAVTHRSRAPFGGARAAWSAPPQRAQQKPQPGAPAAGAVVWHPLAAAVLAAAPAAAEEVPSAPAGGVNVVEIAILAAPLLLYGVFNLYRDKVNPNAKVSRLPACQGGPCACGRAGLRGGGARAAERLRFHRGGRGHRPEHPVYPGVQGAHFLARASATSAWSRSG